MFVIVKLDFLDAFADVRLRKRDAGREASERRNSVDAQKPFPGQKMESLIERQRGKRMYIRDRNVKEREKMYGRHWSKGGYDLKSKILSSLTPSRYNCLENYGNERHTEKTGSSLRPGWDQPGTTSVWEPVLMLTSENSRISERVRHQNM